MDHMNLDIRNEDLRCFFDRKAAENAYDCVHTNFMDTKEQLTFHLADNTKNVLDLGAGTGLELIPLFNRFPQANVTAVDLSRNMLDVLKNRPFADRVRIVCGDFFSVPFGNGYDAVISTSALHHFDEDVKLALYRKVFDSLVPGGLFLNADCIVNTLEEQQEIFRLYYENPKLYVHFDTPLAAETELRLLGEAGFTEVTVNDMENPKYKFVRAGKPRA